MPEERPAVARADLALDQQLEQVATLEDVDQRRGAGTAGVGTRSGSTV